MLVAHKRTPEVIGIEHYQARYFTFSRNALALLFINTAHIDSGNVVAAPGGHRIRRQSMNWNFLHLVAYGADIFNPEMKVRLKVFSKP